MKKQLSKFFILAVLLSPLVATAQVKSISVSPDITLLLESVVTTDQDVAQDNLSGNVVLQAIGPIPHNADLSVYHLLANGDRLVAFDITVELPGPLVAQPRDIVRYNGASFSLEFDGSAQNVPAGARIDALSVNGDGDLLMSFDTTVSLSGTTAADEDVVAFDGTNFTLVFDGSAQGVPVGADLDALHFAAETGRYYMSFDSGGMINGTTFSDEDLLEHNPGASSWTLAYDGSSVHSAWVGGDLDAVFVAFLVDLIFQDGFETL